ncbi:putative acyl-CoA thioester hydrolase [Candidatus Kinetoplastibacterium sorsogonicusi]|uniref:Putative acyl-CoA thioester hydrolase n=1 Tax=Candidatus Kinetoplastidibacterium kentomonadis TaxID=1576550 RepID=A0A3S7J9A4_9PROT|nr:acyl-CoA thioesterase [Candidatus Kinetoplastibacterium sorsogonicusi]AWD32252.1 putative acyl-CoA thioester hydrolase [Candidatus Kinetoplastibacterium sorsogonicusi]
MCDGNPIIKIMPMPADSNLNGKVFGGWIMSQIDIAGSILARERAQGKVATVAVNHIHFKYPMLIGDLISIYANIIKTGNTSITIKIEVFSNRSNGLNNLKTVDAILTYVAIDDNNNSRILPNLS